MKKVELKKIKEEELTKLQNFELFFTKANETLGKLVAEFEFKKSDVLRQISDQHIKREEFKKDLSNSYGENITVNISTGEISEPQK